MIISGWNVLLLHLAGVVVEGIERAGSGVRVWARVSGEVGVFPSCGCRSRRVHSRYDRKVADVPVAGRAVMLRLEVRRRRQAGETDCAQRR
ncbi:transposase family protein [Alloactinosynnema sp. L-07]|uniref:transposase family protein n=1 Tax=Alloactinosynnema sp. L-07 TaxID=1653480 RepID=UPI0009EEAB2B|nr:transposase family protein [Alloactinosynnema sp. L-07]